MVLGLIYSSHQDLSFYVNKELKNQILEGQHFISDFFQSKTIIKFGKKFFKYNILYLEQLTTPDNTKLLQWKEIIPLIKDDINNRITPRKPKLFQIIENFILNNIHR